MDKYVHRLILIYLTHKRLIASIKAKRPELLENIPLEQYANVPPIGCEPPQHIIDKYTTSMKIISSN